MLWTKEEIAILRQNLSIEEMEALLPHRTRKSIQNKKSRVTPALQVQWTQDERNLLARYYEEEGQAVMERLPGRSWDSIRSQVYYLRKRGWSI